MIWYTAKFLLYSSEQSILQRQDHSLWEKTSNLLGNEPQTTGSKNHLQYSLRIFFLGEPKFFLSLGAFMYSYGVRRSWTAGGPCFRKCSKMLHKKQKAEVSILACLDRQPEITHQPQCINIQWHFYQLCHGRETGTSDCF